MEVSIEEAILDETLTKKQMINKAAGPGNIGQCQKWMTLFKRSYPDSNYVSSSITVAMMVVDACKMT